MGFKKVKGSGGGSCGLNGEIAGFLQESFAYFKEVCFIVNVQNRIYFKNRLNL